MKPSLSPWESDMAGRNKVEYKKEFGKPRPSFFVIATGSALNTQRLHAAHDQGSYALYRRVEHLTSSQYKLPATFSLSSSKYLEAHTL